MKYEERQTTDGGELRSRLTEPKVDDSQGATCLVIYDLTIYDLRFIYDLVI